MVAAVTAAAILVLGTVIMGIVIRTAVGTIVAGISTAAARVSSASSACLITSATIVVPPAGAPLTSPTVVPAVSAASVIGASGSELEPCLESRTPVSQPRLHHLGALGAAQPHRGGHPAQAVAGPGFRREVAARDIAVEAEYHGGSLDRLAPAIGHLDDHRAGKPGAGGALLPIARYRREPCRRPVARQGEVAGAASGKPGQGGAEADQE